MKEVVKMSNKKILLFVFSVLMLVSFLSVTDAAIRLELANRSNISGSTFLNASITGLTGNVNIRNVSFYYQVFGGSTWTLIATTNNVSTNQSYFNTTWDTTAVTDGRNYTLNVTSMDYAAGTVNATNITVSATIDNTPPTIAVYGTAPTVYANGTSIKTSTSSANNLTLSIYITDATIGMANQSRTSVCFVNVGGGVNHTIPMFSTGLTTGWCNASDTNVTGLNISDLDDGNNTINIYLNDTLTNRLNSTLVAHIDTTSPTSTAACSPTTVNAGDTFPCTCSGTDATSGVSTSTGTSTSGTVTSTANTGAFTYTCTVTDNGGLSSTATKAYSIVLIPSSGPSSGTTTVTHTVSSEVFANGYTTSLPSNNQLKVTIDSEAHYVKVDSVSATQVKLIISSDPVEVTLAEGEEAKFDVTDDGYYDLQVTLNDIANNKANVTIQKIYELIPEGQGAVSAPGIEEEQAPAEKGNLTWLWIVIGAVVIIAILWAISRRKK